MHTEFLVRGVLVSNGHLLLAMNKEKKHLFLPGGHIKFAESASNALVREIKEEIGFTVTVKHFIGAVEHKWKSARKVHAELNLIFSMSCSTLHSRHSPVSKEKKIMFIWHPLNDLTAIKFQPSVLCSLLPAWISKTPPERWASSYSR